VGEGWGWFTTPPNCEWRPQRAAQGGEERREGKQTEGDAKLRSVARPAYVHFRSGDDICPRKWSIPDTELCAAICKDDFRTLSFAHGIATLEIRSLFRHMRLFLCRKDNILDDGDPINELKTRNTRCCRFGNKTGDLWWFLPKKTPKRRNIDERLSSIVSKYVAIKFICRRVSWI